MALSDSGAGMSRKLTRDVFKDGIQFNVNELQAGQGSGLWLYIAKGISEQHAGHLMVESEGLGKGTTFTLGFLLFRVVTDDQPSESYFVPVEDPSSPIWIPRKWIWIIFPSSQSLAK